MSFHLLHILSANCTLLKSRGNLIYSNKETNKSSQIPLEDLRGIILATYDIVLTDQVISTILENGAFILHCDKKFKPIGLTAPLQRLINVEVAKNQAKASQKLNSSIWKDILNSKINNQKCLLEHLDMRHEYLSQKLSETPINESACARHYWFEYFSKVGHRGLTRRNDPHHELNAMLNYGYAVLGGLCHRSLVAHGLSPLLGVHHRPSFHGTPLVYDVIEPWRPFVDYYLFLYLSKNPKINMPDWIKEVSQCWQHSVTISQNNKQKLVDAIDYAIQSVASVYSKNKVEGLWLPELIIEQDEVLSKLAG